MQWISTVSSEAIGLPALEDEALASCSSARLLITAAAVGEAEARARRIHARGAHRNGPFVRTDAGNFPTDDRQLRLMCVDLLESAAGGTLFIHAVNTMPALVQGVFIELMDELEPRGDARRAVRLVSSTSVSLLDCIAMGRFAERLFYRLNIIHLTQADGAAVVST